MKKQVITIELELADDHVLYSKEIERNTTGSYDHLLHFFEDIGYTVKNIDYGQSKEAEKTG